MLEMWAFRAVIHLPPSSRSRSMLRPRSGDGSSRVSKPSSARCSSCLSEPRGPTSLTFAAPLSSRVRRAVMAPIGVRSEYSPHFTTRRLSWGCATRAANSRAGVRVVNCKSVIDVGDRKRSTHSSRTRLAPLLEYFDPSWVQATTTAASPLYSVASVRTGSVRGLTPVTLQLAGHVRTCRARHGRGERIPGTQRFSQLRCLGGGWQRGQKKLDRFMKCSRRIRAPQRRHGIPSCPYAASDRSK